jgi:hypothetical protein
MGVRGVGVGGRVQCVEVRLVFRVLARKGRAHHTPHTAPPIQSNPIQSSTAPTHLAGRRRVVGREVSGDVDGGHDGERARRAHPPGEDVGRRAAGCWCWVSVLLVAWWGGRGGA